MQLPKESNILRLHLILCMKTRLAKVHYFGFIEVVVKWIKSYLLIDRQLMTKLVSDSYEQLLKRRRSLRSRLGPILQNLCRSAEDSQHPSSCSHWFDQCFSNVILCTVTAPQRGKLIEFKSLTTLMFVSSLIFGNHVCVHKPQKISQCAAYGRHVQDAYHQRDTQSHVPQ